MKDALFSLISLVLMSVLTIFFASSLHERFFLSMALVVAFAAIRVVSSSSPVHSALFLILTFFSTAVLWIIQGAEFLGVLLVLVYVGAVLVLLLFVVMMVNLDHSKKREYFWRYFPTAFLVGILVLVEMGFLWWQLFYGSAPFTATVRVVPGSLSHTNAHSIAELMFGDYSLAFEMVGLILLVAMVAALVLTLNEHKRMKLQNIGEQVRVRASDRLLIRKDDRSETTGLS